MDEKYAIWKGVDRKKIEWNPIIDKNKCTGRGMCVTSCGRAVYDYDWEEEKSVVARPYNCLVGCTSCQKWCIFEAISFPDGKIVKDFIKKNKILLKAKEELDQLKEK